MHNETVELSNVVYNAADQRFEALATVYGATQTRKFACAIDAPINMSFEDAAKGLSVQALRRHAGRGGLFSRPAKAGQLRPRAARIKPTKVDFDPFEVLRRLAA